MVVIILQCIHVLTLFVHLKITKYYDNYISIIMEQNNIHNYNWLSYYIPGSDIVTCSESLKSYVAT